MAQRSREESLRIIQDFVNSSKGAANTAAPAPAQPTQQRMSREDSLRIIRDFVSSGNNQDSAASGGRSGSFAGKKAAAGLSGKFGQADSVQTKTDTRSSERAALEAQLNELNDLGFNATAKQQAEAQAKRAQIEKRLKEIDESSKPNKDTSGLNAAQAERFNELQEELASIKLPSFVPAGGPARELANRREEILAELDELDKAAGRDARSYDGLSRRTNWLKSWLNRTGASYTNVVGNMAELINREDKPIQGRDYEAENAKFAEFIERFNPEVAAELSQNVPQANKKISNTFKKVSDGTYKAADTMLERSEGQLAKAKYGVSGAESIAMDAGGVLLDIAVDRLGAAARIPGLANMFTRVYGSTAQEARLRGDDAETASLKGLKAAAIEVATEKIGGAFEGAYGNSLTSEAMGAVRRKFGNVMNRLERSGALRWVLDTVGEGGEEALADILNIAVDHMVGWDDGSMTTIEDILSQKDDILYDSFLGSLVGSLGATTNLISDRANARANAQNSVPAQTAQEAQNVQRDIPAAPKTEKTRTANSGALNAAIETIGAVTRTGGSVESAMKLLSPKQIEAYNNYLAEKNAAEEADFQRKKSEEQKAQGQKSEQVQTEEAKSEKPVAENSGEQYNKFTFDYKAANEEANAAYDAEVMKWYEQHPDAQDIDPESPLYDRNTFVNQRVREMNREAFIKYRQEAQKTQTEDDLTDEIEWDEDNVPDMEENHHQETRHDDYRRDDEAYKHDIDRVYSSKSVTRQRVGEYGTSRGTFRSDAEAPPVTAAERRYAKLMEKERADSIERREAARAAVTENATERMERLAAENKLLRKVAEAKTEEERASAQEEYKKFKDNKAANPAAKNGGENDVHRIRYDEVRGRPELESGDRGNIENVRRGADSRELGRLSEVVRHTDPAERGQRLEEVKANKVIHNLNGGENDVHSTTAGLEAQPGTGESNGRADGVSGLAGREPRGGKESQRRISEVVRGAREQSRLGIRLALSEAGYKVVQESNYSPEVREAAELIQKLTSGNSKGAAYVEVIDGSPDRHALTLRNRPEIGVILDANGAPDGSLKQIAIHEATHVQMPEDIRKNTWDYVKGIVKGHGFTNSELKSAIRSYSFHSDYYSRKIAGKPFADLEKGSRDY
jgi:hypothetical protein